MGVSIAICDDERAQTLYLEALVKRWANERGVRAEIESFDSAEAFKAALNLNRLFHILLLDIQMSGQSGISLARELRQAGGKLAIVFITGLSEFMSEGYDVSALHYLMKPVKENKLFEVLDKARQSLTQAEKSLIITVDGEVRRVPFSEIRCIEAQNHYAVIRMAARGELRVKQNLSELQKSLDSGFFRCQRSFIVNLAFVRRITRTAIELDGGTEVPMSRGMYEEANQAVIKFFPF